jgi:hypothetical protein
MMKKPRTLGEFLATLVWSDPVDWIGDTGYVRLDRDRRACIQAIHGPPNTSQYYGVRVTIVHRKRGAIVHDDFLFADHLDPGARTDGRGDHPSDFYLWRCSERGWGWYIAVPADTSPLTAVVKRFIDTFR